MTTPAVTKITLHKISKILEVEFVDGECFKLPCAYLRAHSSSAEMRGIEPNAVLPQFAQVTILAIEPVGNYAIKPIFSDGHRTGIYSFATLYHLGLQLKNKP